MDRTASLGSNMLTPEMPAKDSPETEVKKEQSQPPERQDFPTAPAERGRLREWA